MTAPVVLDYVTAPTGTVHLTVQDPGAARSLCGRSLVGWTMGDESVAYIATTCERCLQIARPVPSEAPSSAGGPRLLERALAVLDEIIEEVAGDPDAYETDVEVLFALAVQAVRRYAEAIDDPFPFVLQAIAENLE